MRDFKKDPKLHDRLGAAAKAQQDALAKYKARSDTSDPEVAARLAAKAQADIEKETRRAALEADKEQRRVAEKAQRAVEEEQTRLASEEAERADAVAREAARIEDERLSEERAVQQKAARDARYAARKARK